MSILKKAIDPLGITDKLFGGSKRAAPQMDPRLAENAGRMSDIARDTYAWNVDEAKRLQPEFQNLAGQTRGITADAIGRSDRIADQYEGTFMPVNERIASDAMNWDSRTNMDAAAGRAVSGVSSAFGRARDQLRGNFARFGTNPSNFASQNYTMAIRQAQAEADAANTARDNRQMQGVTLRQNAGNFGRGILQDATSQAGLGITGANATSGLMTGGMDAYNRGTGAALPWFTGANNAFQGIYSNQMQQYNTDMQRDAARWAGIGQLVGTGVGFMVGGPKGAMLGAQAGKGITQAQVPGSVGGGAFDWSNYNK